MHSILRFILISSSLLFLFAQISYAAVARETSRDERFIAYSDGTILDTQTKLMWAAKDNGVDIKLQSDANKYCINYRKGGYTDWRMPTLAELKELYWAGKVIGNKKYMSKDERLFLAGKRKNLATNITKMFIWASDTHGSEFARFSFTFNSVYWVSPSETYVIARALPVRSSK